MIFQRSSGKFQRMAANCKPINKPMTVNLLAVLTLSLLSCPHFTHAEALPSPVCAFTDKQCAVDALKDNQAQKSFFWKKILAQPLEKRIGRPPAELLRYVQLDNIAQQIPNKPREPKLSDELINDVQMAVAELPNVVKSILSSKLAGIYLVDDLGGTGLTDTIWDAEKRPVAAFVILDAAVLSRQSANSWATWKENSVFKQDSQWHLTAEIETPDQNNRKNAIQYIILHELGHVFSVGSNVHPSWNIPAKEILPAASYPFYRLSWTASVKDNRHYSLFDDAFPQRREIVYYFGPRFSAEQVPDLYKKLVATNFVTLYGATSPGDDFAESFVTYVHTVLMKKPFAIRMFKDDQLIVSYSACWSEPRCASKKKILDNIFSTPHKQ